MRILDHNDPFAMPRAAVQSRCAVLRIPTPSHRVLGSDWKVTPEVSAP